jgi:lipopolysaccharide transport system ATP-binding protein
MNQGHMAIITAENIGKRYRIRHQKTEYYKTLADTIVHGIADMPKHLFAKAAHPRPEDFWALKDVSFEINPCEKVGIVGRNGAGKSTLLKILSRITAPTIGRARIRGRVASLLEVGTGFHPELSGRDNIFLNGAILGMTRGEIQRKFDEIVAFSEIEKFLDTPVKRYSSGMYVRLAFAIASHLELEILLIDEVLAVGDAIFQKKCLNKMARVAQQGITILFVSHNMVAVENLCDTGLMLERGRLVLLGKMDEVVRRYSQSMRSVVKLNLQDRTDRIGDGKLRFTMVYFLDVNRQPVESFITGKDAIIALEYETKKGQELHNISFGVGINASFGNRLTTLDSEVTQEPFKDIPDRGVIYCLIPRMPLVADEYNINVFCEANGSVVDWVINAASFRVEPGDFFGTGRLLERAQATFLLENHWEVVNLSN